MRASSPRWSEHPPPGNGCLSEWFVQEWSEQQAREAERVGPTKAPETGCKHGLLQGLEGTWLPAWLWQGETHGSESKAVWDSG